MTYRFSPAGNGGIEGRSGVTPAKSGYMTHNLTAVSAFVVSSFFTHPAPALVSECNNYR